MVLCCEFTGVLKPKHCRISCPDNTLRPCTTSILCMQQHSKAQHCSLYLATQLFKHWTYIRSLYIKSSFPTCFISYTVHPFAWHNRLCTTSAPTTMRKSSPTNMIIGILTLLLMCVTAVRAQACTVGSAQEINGNWYCSPVDAITYTGFPGRGSYNKVTSMNADTGVCSNEVHLYSGSLSPLNEEVSATVVCSSSVIEVMSNQPWVSRNSCPCTFVDLLI